MSSRAWTIVPIGLFVGLLLTAGPAAAQVQTETLTVQARINEACTVTSASLDFGQGIVLDEDTDAAGSIEISCAGGASLNVALDAGQNFMPLFGSRTMAGAGGQIMYSLYKDSGRTQAWNVGDPVQAAISSGTGTVPVYGRIPEQSNGHSAGLYTDEVTITLSF